MELVDWISDSKKEIIREWIRYTMEAYPAESLAVLNRNKDQFANPLPHVISKNIELLFEELLKEVKTERIKPILTEIVRIKAVQDFTPSQSLGFIFDLKKILKKICEGYSGGEEKALKGLESFDRKIDMLARTAFDIYVDCREKLFEIKVNEIRNQTHMLIRRVSEMDKQKEAR